MYIKFSLPMRNQKVSPRNKTDLLILVQCPISILLKAIEKPWLL